MLDLSSNQLDFTPPEIGCLRLRELDIKDNKHIRVPELVKVRFLLTVFSSIPTVLLCTAGQRGWHAEFTLLSSNVGRTTSPDERPHGQTSLLRRCT